MEVLSEALRAVKLTGAVFPDAEFRAPWCIVARGKMARLLMPGVEHFIHYHYVLEYGTAPRRWRRRDASALPVSP